MTQTMLITNKDFEAEMSLIKKSIVNVIAWVRI